MGERGVWRRRCQSPRERRTFARLLLIYRNIRKISPVQCPAQAALNAIEAQHTPTRGAANEATPEIIAECIELFGDIGVLRAVEAVPMRVAHAGLTTRLSDARLHEAARNKRLRLSR
jgi:hypothetical protein